MGELLFLARAYAFDVATMLVVVFGFEDQLHLRENRSKMQWRLLNWRSHSMELLEVFIEALSSCRAVKKRINCVSGFESFLGALQEMVMASHDEDGWMSRH